MANLHSTLPKIGHASSFPSTGAWSPQFTSAQYGKASSSQCRSCSRDIPGEYFIVNRRKVCAECAELARRGISIPSPGAWAGGLVYGLGGALLGMILYASFTITTGWTVGFLALGVGWIVGAATMAGADNVGGTRLQLLAAALAYLAITLKEVPIVLYGFYAHFGFVEGWEAQFFHAIFAGLASPFHGFNAKSFTAILNLVILALSLRIAWQLTRPRRFIVSGPFGTE